MNRFVFVLVVFATVLTGCQSTQCTEPKPYQSARRLPELVVPADLDAPPGSRLPDPPRVTDSESPCLEKPPGLRNPEAGDEVDEEPIEESVDEEAGESGTGDSAQ